MDGHRCRFCARALDETFVDLGLSPLANSYLPPERADATEPTYPLHARVCRACGLVQLPQFEPAATSSTSISTTRPIPRAGCVMRRATPQT